MKYFLLAFTRIIDFKGRSRRKEYWFFYLFNILLFFIYTTIAVTLKIHLLPHLSIILGFLIILHILIVILTSITLIIRRLHDIGKSGTYIFINLIPFLGNFAFLMMMINKGEEKKTSMA